MLPVIAAAGVGYLAGRKGKKKPKTIKPTLEVPYLSPEQIQAHPALNQLYGMWQDLAAGIRGGALPTGIPAGVFQNLMSLAMPGMDVTELPTGGYNRKRFPRRFRLRWVHPSEQSAVSRQPTTAGPQQPDITGAISTIADLMRPLFEQQLRRQLEMTREQLAAATGAPTGGAIAEVMRRQIAEAERGWQAQLGQMGMQELQAQRQLMQWATEALPRMMAAQQQLYFTPYTMLASALQPFVGTFVSPQQVVRPPSTLEQILPPLLLGGIFGGLFG